MNKSKQRGTWGKIVPGHIKRGNLPRVIRPWKRRDKVRRRPDEFGAKFPHRSCVILAIP